MSAKIAYFLISEDDVRIGEHNGEQFVWLEYVKFENKTEFYHKERLQQILDNYRFDSPEYSEHLLAWYTPQSTLIPMNLMDDLNPKQLLTYTFSEIDVASNIDYNRIAEISIVNIFTIPLWVKSFFVMRFPRIVTLHLGSGLIRGILNAGQYKDEIHVVLQSSHALIIYTGQNQLKHYNSYEFSTAEDLLYYLVNLLTQHEAQEKRGKIYCYGDDFDFQTLEEKFRQLKISQFYSVSHSSQQLLNYLSACV